MTPLLALAYVAAATSHSNYLGRYDCHPGQAYDRMASADEQKEAKSHPLAKDEFKAGLFSMDIQDGVALVTPSSSDPFDISGEHVAVWGAKHFTKDDRSFDIDTFEFTGNAQGSNSVSGGERAVSIRVEFWPQYTYMWIDMPEKSLISSGPARYHSIFAGCVKAGSKQ